jgi:hypothetical protein
MALMALIRGETAWFVWHRTAAAWQSSEMRRKSSALNCKGRARRRNAQQRQSTVKNSIETFGAVYSKGYGWQ